MQWRRCLFQVPAVAPQVHPRRGQITAPRNHSRYCCTLLHFKRQRIVTEAELNRCADIVCWRSWLHRISNNLRLIFPIFQLNTSYSALVFLSLPCILLRGSTGMKSSFHSDLFLCKSHASLPYFGTARHIGSRLESSCWKIYWLQPHVFQSVEDAADVNSSTTDYPLCHGHFHERDFYFPFLHRGLHMHYTLFRSYPV